MNDLRFVVRQLLKTPSFTCVAVLTLTLGFGANFALFTAFYDQFLRPKPLAHPETLWQIMPADSTGEQKFFNLSRPYYEELRRSPGAFDAVIGMRSLGLKIRSAEGWEPALGQLVSADYFSFLGVQPMLGRGFLPGDGIRSSVAVISHRLWQERFGGTSDVLNRSLSLKGDYPESIVVEIVGVTPARFTGLGSALRDVILPIEMESRLTVPSGYSMFGRLKEGMSSDAAADSLAPVVQEISKAVNSDIALKPFAGNNSKFTRVALLPAGYGTFNRAFLPNNRQRILQVATLAAAGSLLVLLIAGLNLAGLLLARGFTRGRELATRLALGATRWDIVKALTIEGAMLGGLGALAVLLVLKWLDSIIPAVMSVATLGGTTPVSLRLDGRVVAVALVGGVAGGVVFSLLPALQISRFDPLDSLKGLMPREGLRRKRGSARQMLIVGQIATSLALLVGAIGCFRAIANQLRSEVGIDLKTLIVAQADIEGVLSRDARYATLGNPRPNADFLKQQAPLICEGLRQRLASIPGVETVGVMGYHAPLGQFPTLTTSRLSGHEGRRVSFRQAVIGPECFQALRLPIVEGRHIEPADIHSNRRVAIVNESLRREFWPDEPVLGRQLFDEQWNDAYEIIGVVRDARLESPTEPPQSTAYLASWVSSLKPAFILRTKVSPESLLPFVAAELARTDSWLRQSVVRTGLGLLRGRFQREQHVQHLLGELTAIALGLTLMGGYGLLTYHVDSRTREIGIRLAVGATPSAIRTLVLKSASKVALAGIAVGLPGMFGVMLMLRRFVIGATPLDFDAYAMASFALFATLLLAAWFPARRAARLDPMRILKCD